MSRVTRHERPVILVVDDSVDDAETYARNLHKAKPETYETRLLSLGKDLLALKEPWPHCLLLDMKLPDMTGLEVLRKLVEGNQGSLPYPVIIITGSGDDAAGRKAVQLGAQDFLQKDEVTPRTLLRAIEFATMRFDLQRQVRASEEKARQLAASMKLAADAGDLGFWSWNAIQGVIIVDVNGRRMLDLAPSGAVNFDDFMAAVYTGDRPGLLRAIGRCMEEGGAYDEEFRVRHQDGSIRWIASRGSVLRSEAGESTGMTGIAIDITEKKKTRDALLENKKRLRQALNAARMSTWDWDLVSGAIEWSENLEEQLAMPRGSFKGSYEAFRSMVHPHDRDVVDLAVKRAIEEGAEYHLEFRMIRADGQVRWTESRGLVSLNEDGQPARMTGVEMDITERRNKEEALRRSEQRTRRLIESNIVPIACAAESGLTEANDAFLKLVGLSREDFEAGRVNWVKITPAEHLPKDFAALEQLKAQGWCTPFEKEYLRPDGSRVPILIGATVMSTEPLEWLCFILDLSELKGVEAQLRKSQSELEQKVEQRTAELAVSLAAVKSEVVIRTQAEKQLSDLSAQLLRLQDEERRRIARDLHDSTGQTLSALKMTLGALGKLLRETPKAVELKEDANTLVDQAVKDIRTLSYVLHPPLLDEAGFASAAQWYVEGFGKRSGVVVTLEMAPALQVSKDAELALFRVLQESLTNVLRHSGSKTAEIRFSRVGARAVLSVSDSGKGIPQHLLEGFLLTGAGVGVGLAGMKQRLRDLGGELKLESGGTGTTVSASVPLERVSFETDRRRAPKARQSELSQ